MGEWMGGGVDGDESSLSQWPNTRDRKVENREFRRCVNARVELSSRTSCQVIDNLDIRNSNHDAKACSLHNRRETWSRGRVPYLHVILPIKFSSLSTFHLLHDTVSHEFSICSDTSIIFRQVTRLRTPSIVIVFVASDTTQSGGVL